MTEITKATTDLLATVEEINIAINGNKDTLVCLKRIKYVYQNWLCWETINREQAFEEVSDVLLNKDEITNLLTTKVEELNDLTPLEALNQIVVETKRELLRQEIQSKSDTRYKKRIITDQDEEDIIYLHHKGYTRKKIATELRLPFYVIKSVLSNTPRQRR